jgi:ABC-type dipeptide/oligopeptide/nickel transport system ATPase component
MSKLQFKKATKRQAKLRMALVGPSGSGKTWKSLAIATALLDNPKIAVIDSERGSASKYAGDPFEFDVLELESFSPQIYCDAIETAEAEGYDVIIVDSLSHAWMGKDGILEQVDAATARSSSKNTFSEGWRKATPMHNQLVDTLLRSRCHVFCTLRTKVEWVIEENDRGKKEPRKVGMQPVQREGLDYEFDVVADVNLDNDLIIGKTRCSALRGRIYHLDEHDKIGRALADWLTDGAAPAPTLADEYCLRFDAATEPAQLNALVGELKEKGNRLSRLDKEQINKARLAAIARIEAARATSANGETDARH